MVTEADIRVADGRILHAYDTCADGIAGGRGPGVAVFWLPNRASSRTRATSPCSTGRRRR